MIQIWIHEKHLDMFKNCTQILGFIWDRSMRILLMVSADIRLRLLPPSMRTLVRWKTSTIGSRTKAAAPSWRTLIGWSWRSQVIDIWHFGPWVIHFWFRVLLLEMFLCARNGGSITQHNYFLLYMKKNAEMYGRFFCTTCLYARNIMILVRHWRHFSQNILILEKPVLKEIGTIV